MTPSGVLVVCSLSLGRVKFRDSPPIALFSGERVFLLEMMDGGYVWATVKTDAKTRGGVNRWLDRLANEVASVRSVEEWNPNPEENPRP